jgi:hypothetical protein
LCHLAGFLALLYSGAHEDEQGKAGEDVTPNPIHIDAVRKIVEAKRQDPFFKRRHERNVKNPPHHFSRDQFWNQMIVCICTSVQKSGPKSRVSKFVREEPFPLRLVVCVEHNNLRQFAERILRSRGLRFGPKLAMQIEANMNWLEDGGWTTVEEQFGNLAALFRSAASPQQRIAAERRAARTVMGRNGGLIGVGPKQARNLWQCLGVTQYEIPLDSRVSNWLNALPSSFGIETSKLYTSIPYYEAKMTHIQVICALAGVLPCEFDAAVFASADVEEWPEDDNVF